MARVVVEFTPAGVARGAEVLIDETKITDSLTVGQIDTLLSPGNHTITVHPVCARVKPSESVSFYLTPGRDELISLRFVPSAGVISIRSDPTGLPTLIDEVPTGLVTPHELTCLEEGEYEIGVAIPIEVALGFWFEGDMTQRVSLAGNETKEVTFALERQPLPQERGVLLELLTSTYCDNCPPAEELLHELEHDPEFEPSWLSTAEVHLSWSGRDVFYNDEVQNRLTHYGDPSSAPIAYFNGADEYRGSAGDLAAAYRTRIRNTYGSDASAGLYWHNARIDGSLLRGDLRFVAIDDLSGLEELELHAFYTKDSLPAPTWPYGEEEIFYGIVRDYLDEPIDLTASGATAPGSFLDVEIVFDLAADAEWATPSIRLAAFVQDGVTGATLQCREVLLRVP
jgi:hypothetical protein